MADDSTIRPDEQTLVDGIELLKATEGQTEPAHKVGDLTAEHEDFLVAHAVDIALAKSLGVRSLVTHADVEDLDGVWSGWANFPAILFPWVSEEGRTEYQLRPDNPTDDTRGRPRKYVFRTGMQPVLWAVRPVPGAKKMIFVEGTKQCLSAAFYAPPDIAVFGISGCRSWQQGGTPIPDLTTVDGCEVVVILDTDAATNPEVYDAGADLARVLDMEGATSVTFTRMFGNGKAGLDDILGSRPAGKRADYLARIIASAKAKPADAKPRRKGGTAPAAGKRVTIICNRDRHEVINDLVDALLKRWNGRELFNHGGVISRLGQRSMRPVDKDSFLDLIQETALTIHENDGANGTTHTFSWPDAQTINATRSRADSFSPLDRVSRAPFARPDGSIVTEPGYDKATKTMLIPDPELEGLEVPEDPSDEQIAEARDLLMTEWFGDMPFETAADRANALALIVTPAIRGLIPKVPMCVVDGLQMGVGKNLLADAVLTVYTGEASRPMNFVDESEEMRKQITSAFRSGQEFFVFDEAHTLQGAALAQALTASTWQDRILGVSTMAEFPNRVTWISLGNQVQVRGDLTRRVYRVSLRPNYANPQDRDSSSFRHPGQSGLDLGSWTRKNRRELLTAALTLVRAWFSRGQPRPTRGVSFGSFEAWERMVGGIVETAGLEDFLGNLKVWRSESDFDSQYWTGHLSWLRDLFGHKPFRTAQVRDSAMDSNSGYLAPPKLDDPTDKGFGKALGEAYSRLRGRRYEGMWIERIGGTHNHVSLWQVFMDSDLPPALPTPDPEPDVPTQPVDKPVENEPIPDRDSSVSAELVTFDLETGDSGDLYRTPGAEFVRLSGWATGNGPIQISDQNPAGSAAAAFTGAATITGHNIMAFDFPALMRAGVVSMEQLHHDAANGRLFDALLVARHLNPPMARDKGVDAERKYDLGELGQKYGLGDKLSDVSKALAKKHGGWAGIPVDDQSEDGQAYREYLAQDVTLSRALYAQLMQELGGSVPDYLVREHRVAALAAQMSVNGFLVDQDLLATRVEEIRDRKADAMNWLSANCDIPTVDARGNACLSPLSTKVGKAALEAALRKAGATSFWRTGVSKEFQMSADHMIHLGSEYHHLPAVIAIVKQVHRIVSARSVYETIEKNMMPNGRVHPRVAFKQVTGRWSLTSPGLTVMGKRGGRHVERAVLLPDPGHVLISIDLSQIDMRAIAGLSQDKAYIRMLHRDDPHSELAVALFGDVKYREEAKAIGHGWNYGESLRRISETNGIAPKLVVQFDASMRDRFPRLIEWREEVRALAASGALLDNGFGRLMRADPRRAHTQGPALMGQGGARDLMMAGMLAIGDRYPAVLPMLRAQIHDEIVLSVPADQAVDVGRAVVECLSFEWKSVPITADVSRPGSDWSRCYAKD